MADRHVTDAGADVPLIPNRLNCWAHPGNPHGCSNRADRFDRTRDPSMVGSVHDATAWMKALGRERLSLVPRHRSQTAAALALKAPRREVRSTPGSIHGMSGQPGNHPRYCRGRGAVDSCERQGRQSKIDIPARPHACGGRDPFGTGKVRRHDLPRRSPPLSRTWLITF